MYVDGFVLLVLYALASAALILGIYNRLEHNDLLKELRKPKIQKQTKTPTKVQRPRGYWD